MRIEVYVFVDIVDCGSFVTQKGAIGILIGLAIGVIAVKMVVAESPVVGAFEVDRDDTQREVALI